MNGRLAAAAAALAATFAASSAHAGWWVYDPDPTTGDPELPRVRFGPHLGFWTGVFDRPARACKDVGFFGEPGFDFDLPQPEPRAGQVQPEPSFGCGSDNSDEIAVTGGVTATFRAIGPIHLSLGLELAYTFPNRDFVLKNQLIAALPIGLGLTFPEWTVRPIAQATITPLLYVTDDARDYALGFELGLALRVPGWGDLVLTGAYNDAETMEGGAFRLALYPL